MVRVENLKKFFPVKRTIGEVLLRVPQRFVKAVDNISFTISKGETFGLVGESGSGKTTTGRLILRLIEPTAGNVYFEDINVTKLSKEELRKFRKNMQIIFQDPMAALNPYMKVGEAIKHGLEIHNIGKNTQERKLLVMKMLERVNLSPPEDFYYRYPHELSGGQRQRIVIARALILKPKFIVADEAIAMLDVSVRSQLLQLLIDLKTEFDLTFLFITHDLATTKYICDRIGVMYLGKIVEIGNFKEIYKDPLHPYTKALISAVPEPDPKKKKKKLMPEGEVPNPINPPPGCKFHPRCPYAMDICKEKEPVLKEIEGRLVACYLYQSQR
ncbi:ABC transporter ATP-binding protein [Thermosipho atlanticus]|uniref:Peptide/nickel transport system ATP-binding protein n=1 Tax=Thermosipho atlanticus DSM 15807 TaxID=1123380 RepID=A0A1M5QUT3_9BACT|nr:ABC transporter ATP-binding protein [Thermosipho atlanticus]SHH17691.1 peptide/nickel transport system ATP-binding protein [Thermosipho atlanticus DSM 15807]